MEPERRITDRLIQYWQGIKGDNVLPSANWIDADEIEDVWANCFIIEIRANPLLSNDYAHFYAYVGQEIQGLMIPDEGEGEGSNLISVDPEKLSAIYNEMLMTKLPIVDEEENQPHANGIMKYRQCLCPIGTPDGQIRGIFGGMRYKIF